MLLYFKVMINACYWKKYPASYKFPITFKTRVIKHHINKYQVYRCGLANFLFGHCSLHRQSQITVTNKLTQILFITHTLSYKWINAKMKYQWMCISVCRYYNCYSTPSAVRDFNNVEYFIRKLHMAMQLQSNSVVLSNFSFK